MFGDSVDKLKTIIAKGFCGCGKNFKMTSFMIMTLVVTLTYLTIGFRDGEKRVTVTGLKFVIVFVVRG